MESQQSQPFQFNYTHTKRAVIINADDYGYCRERNQGILELIELKAITSVSVMINALNIQQSVDRLLSVCKKMRISNYEISIGLHFNLTEFKRVSQNQLHTNSQQTEAQKLFYNFQLNRFHGKQFFYNNLQKLSNSQLLGMIAQELESQINKFIKLFSFRPSHIDGHNHIHVVPQIAEIVSQKCPLYGIYCVRVPIPFSIKQQQPKQTNTMNHLFIQNACRSQQYFSRSGMISCQYMIGLQTMGNRFTSSAIENQLTKIDNGSVEIMCHPGYKQQEYLCSFSGSSQREHEMKVLKSSQFKTMIDNNAQKCTYYELRNQRLCSCNAIIYSKLLNGSGNLTTSLRVKQTMQKLGYFSHVYLVNVPENNEISQKSEIDNLRRMILNHHIKCIIGVNITKTAQTIYEATNCQFKFNRHSIKLPIPYYLIVAGTDINVSLTHKSACSRLKKSITECEGLICLSAHMQLQMQKFMSTYDVNKKICVIEQSTPTGQNLQVMGLSENSKKPYILMLTSFRKVKAVDYVLKQLNQLIEKYDIQVVILGPIIDKQYFEQTKQKLNKVSYLGTVAYEQSLRYLQNCIFLINSSESQGMSCAILQAFHQQVPVIARNNAGNCQLIKHDCNGYIYESQTQFKQFAIKLLECSSLRMKLGQQGYRVLQTKFSYEQQQCKYRELFKQYFEYYFDTISQNDSSLRLMTIPGVHRTSSINIAIFRKMFEDPHSLQQIRNILSDIKVGGSLNILDMGCGNGVFAIYFIFRLLYHYTDVSAINHQIKINVTFIDAYQPSVYELHRIYGQYRKQKLQNYKFMLSKTTVLQSDMFQQLRQQQINQFDIILANLPQSPFLNSSSRPDKNGGVDGLRLYRQLFQGQNQFMKSQQSRLILLYSYLVDRLSFQKLMSQFHCHTVWKSQSETHIISKQSLQRMQSGMADRIYNLMRNNKAEIWETDGKFHIPADIRIIKTK